MLFWLILGNFRFSVVTLVTFTSSNLINKIKIYTDKRNTIQITKDKQNIKKLKKHRRPKIWKISKM